MAMNNLMTNQLLSCILFGTALCGGVCADCSACPLLLDQLHCQGFQLMSLWLVLVGPVRMKVQSRRESVYLQIIMAIRTMLSAQAVHDWTFATTIYTVKLLCTAGVCSNPIEIPDRVMGTILPGTL